MKQIIVFFLVFISSLSAYCQVNNLEEGNQCFNQGDYICAEAKYKEVFKTAEGKDKKIAEIKIQRAKRCIENLKNADLSFNSKNYTKAKELYLAVLDSNPNDVTAKSQLEIISTFLSKPKTTILSLSKTDISFDSSGGTSNISVDTNLSSYTINLLPTWCTVQKYDKYFVINCNSYNASTLRKDYFNVIAGDKTIRVNVVQQGATSVKENYLNISKTNLAFSSRGGYDEVKVTTNAIDFTASWFPSWCIINKYKDYVAITCLSNESGQSRSDWFKLNAGNKEVKIYVVQEGNVENSVVVDPKPPRPKLGPFSSIGFQSGEIAKYGFIYERGGKKTVGFRISARTSLTSEQDILNGTATKNKTEIELGPNFRLFNRLYFNIGVGYGYYERLLNNDYAGDIYLEKTGYSVATTGLMFRVSRVININGGVSFMDIDKEIYKPEITFGVTFNLKKNNASQTNSYKTEKEYKSEPTRKYKTKLASFSSLGFQSGEIAKYGLLYETGGRRTIGFHISARTTLKPEQIFSGGDIENKKEIELGPNFRMSNRIYLNLGIGYGNYEYPYQDKIGYYIATTGIMYRISRVININGGLSFNYIDNNIYIDNTLQKTEITFGISFNLRGKYKY